nr:putative methyltransferase [Lotus japonicus]
MNKGVGETSYVMNSTLQSKIIDVTNPATKKAIVEILCSSRPVRMGIADLGCSSGPNTLRVISEIVDVVHATSRVLDCPVPELVVHLNDLFTNDFNTVFDSLPSFYKTQRQEKGNGFGSTCFVSAVPGSFYGRLFPNKGLHFVHSSSSLHWLSQAPLGLKDGWGRGLNKGKIYISKSSPQCVLDAYLRQFQNDFSLFLKSRSQEVVAGGRMVLSFMGRQSMDPTTLPTYWELLAHALMSMVSEGLVEEEKVNSFDVPYYAPCIEELKLEIEKEGSFMVISHEAYEIDWGAGMELQSDSTSRGELVARTIRAVAESILEFHFGSHIIDEVFRRYAKLVEEQLSILNLVISLVKRD